MSFLCLLERRIEVLVLPQLSKNGTMRILILKVVRK